MQNKTVSELRILARKLGIVGYSRMRKDELIKTLSKVQKKKIEAKAKKASQNKSRKKVEVITAPKTKAKQQVNTTKKRKVLKKASATQKISVTTPEVTVIKTTALSEELQVEDAKYVTAQPGTHVPTDFVDDLGEDLDNLPLLNGPKLSFLPQKPGVFHASWALAPEHLARKSGLHLRLLSLSSGTISLLEEIPLPADRGYWYFHIDPMLDASKIYLQLGSYNENKDFVIAIVRGIVRIPRLAASPNTDRRWWISEEEFRRLYLAAGGYLEGDRLLWKTHCVGSWQGLGGLRNLSSW